MKRNSEFKIACSKVGIWHFAHVKIQASSTNHSQIINSIVKPVDTEEAEIDEKTHPDWFNAAVDGIQSALKYIQRYRSEKFTIEINCIKGVEVDTRTSDVEAAAFIATINGILGDTHSYQLNTIEDKWNIIVTSEMIDSGSTKLLDLP